MQDKVPLIPLTPLNVLQVEQVSLEAFALSGLSPFRTPLRSVYQVIHPEHGHLGYLIEHSFIPKYWDDELIAEPYRRRVRENGKEISERFKWVRLGMENQASLAFDKEQALVLLWNDFLRRHTSAAREAKIAELALKPMEKTSTETETQ